MSSFIIWQCCSEYCPWTRHWMSQLYSDEQSMKKSTNRETTNCSLFARWFLHRSWPIQTWAALWFVSDCPTPAQRDNWFFSAIYNIESCSFSNIKSIKKTASFNRQRLFWALFSKLNYCNSSIKRTGCPTSRMSNIFTAWHRRLVADICTLGFMSDSPDARQLLYVIHASCHHSWNHVSSRESWGEFMSVRCEARANMSLRGFLKDY